MMNTTINKILREFGDAYATADHAISLSALIQNTEELIHEHYLDRVAKIFDQKKVGTNE